MRIHNLYVGAKGETHFRDRRRLRARLASGAAPAVINLDGGVEITASDGEKRTIGAGEVLLVEDVTGKGHLSKGSRDGCGTRSSYRSSERQVAHWRAR